MEELNAPISNWSFFQKVSFRLFFLLFVLVILVHPIGAFSFWHSIYGIFLTPIQLFVGWMGKLLLNGKEVTQPARTGSGDTTFQYILLLGICLVTVIGTIIWSVLDRNRLNYRKLLYLLTVLIRFYLGYMMISYGLAKLYNMQFGDVSEYRLKSTYGQSSPMGLAWTFFAYSKKYKYFMGFAEIIGGSLLFFRRTVSLGAVITLAVTINIMAVNYCFDVPVKISSTILMLMGLFLILKNAERYLNFFLLNKATKPVNLGYFNGKKHSLPITSLKYALILYLILPLYKSYALQKDRFKIYGLYIVEDFNLNIAGNKVDSLHWKRLDIGFDSVKVWSANNKSTAYFCSVDYVSKKLVLFNAGSNSLAYEFSYQQLDPDFLTLSSNNFPKQELLYIKSRKFNFKSYPLINRGFHWINEHPYNK